MLAKFALLFLLYNLGFLLVSAALMIAVHPLLSKALPEARGTGDGPYELPLHREHENGDARIQWAILIGMNVFWLTALIMLLGKMLPVSLRGLVDTGTFSRLLFSGKPS